MKDNSPTQHHKTARAADPDQLTNLSTCPDWLVRREICSLPTARRVAAMLDLSPDGFADGQPLPQGWQFTLMGADTPRSQLRADGFPGLGVKMPDLGLPRLLLGGRSVQFYQDIPIGASISRKSSIQSLKNKSTESGPMAIATIEHRISIGEDVQPALVETQTYVLLPARKSGSDESSKANAREISGDKVTNFVPDETLLFQYSALGFNSHKIHIDRLHARNIEGFPDLVVNGGLITLFLTEFFRREIGLTMSSLKVRHIAPLFCSRPVTMAIALEGQKWFLRAYDHRSILAVEAEVATHDI